MTRVTSATQIKSLGKILGVWAHPDDETFVAGGLLAMAAKNGQEVICVTATRGEAGTYDEERWPADKIGKIRSDELATAQAILGVKTNYMLDYPDDACQDVDPAEATKRLQEIIAKHQPDAIVTFAPDGLTGHPDHKTVSMWVGLAVKDMPKPPAVYHSTTREEAYTGHLREMDIRLNFYYNLRAPALTPGRDCHICLDLSPEILDKKYEALQAHSSQYTSMFDSFNEDAIKQAFSKEGFTQA